MQKILLTFLMLCFTVPAMAQDKSSIEIIQPYAFATTSAARSAAAFMVIQNNTNADDRLIEAASSISEITEIHQNLIDPDDGTMMMRKIKGLDIPANAAATLEPKGYHNRRHHCPRHKTKKQVTR